MADLRTEIIDGIKLSNNGIGIVNYETLANLPNLNNYVKKGETVGTISDTGTGLQIASNGKLTARNADIKGNFDGTFNGKFGGEVIATKLTLNNVKIPYTNISGTPTLHKVATSGSYNDLSGTPTLHKVETSGSYNDLSGTPTLHKVATSGSYNDLSGVPSLAPYMKKDGTVYGTISDTGIGVKVENNGKLTARGADIKGSFSGSANITSGTIGGCNITDGKLYIPYSQIINLTAKTQFSGTYGSINLESESKTLEVNNATVNSNFNVKGKFSAGIYNSFEIFEPSTDISGTSTFLASINENFIVRAAFRCADLSEQTKTKGEAIYRNPICSAGTNGSQIGYCQSTTNNGTPRVRVYAQWGNSNFSESFINIDSTSDVRLKENIKKSTVSALPIITNMLIREFDWKESKVHQPLGLIADEIEKFDPLLTIGGGYDADGSMNIKSIDRLLLTEYAIKAIQEQQDIINRQQKEIDKLKNILNIN